MKKIHVSNNIICTLDLKTSLLIRLVDSLLRNHVVTEGSSILLHKIRLVEKARFLVDDSQRGQMCALMESWSTPLLLYAASFSLSFAL